MGWLAAPAGRMTAVYWVAVVQQAAQPSEDSRQCKHCCSAAGEIRSNLPQANQHLQHPPIRIGEVIVQGR